MLKAIILDESAITRDLLRQVLNSGGHQVVGDCSLGTQGLALMVKHQPHFICVNRGMCEDGHELLAKIHQTLPKALVFLVCSQLDASTLQAYVSQGVHGFIIKPFNTTAVLNTIKKAVLGLVKRAQAKAGEAD